MAIPAEGDRSAMTRYTDAEMAGKFDIVRITRDRDAPARFHAGGYVWLGDLDGFKLAGDYDGFVNLIHRSCWKETLGGPYGHLVDTGPFLGNLVFDALMHRCDAPTPRLDPVVRQLGYLVHALSAVACFIEISPPDSRQRLLAASVRTRLGMCARMVSPENSAKS